jgi:hypothetical protein
MPIKIPASFFTENPEFIWRYKRPWLNSKNNTEQNDILETSWYQTPNNTTEP